MTQEDRQLLLKDLCGRLPYGVLVEQHLVNAPEETNINYIRRVLQSYMVGDFWQSIENVIIKPCLRPMSSMTEEEVETYHNLQSDVWKPCGTMYYDNIRSIDWLNEHHFDYRRLIEKGLALEAPEDMYKMEE